ncbi:hypothetical protein D8L93_01545 [Sodalis-like symbiont of Bactericera trigonica]|nr:hypothetical protein D8L93_01545 [Sodalis-like symbiont of Bactericera trigonica]
MLMLVWSGYHARLLLQQTKTWSQGNQTLITRLVTLNLTDDKAPVRLVARVSYINGQRVFPPVAVVRRPAVAIKRCAVAGTRAYE